MLERKLTLMQFSLLLAEDGSGKGAGLAAAIAQRLKNKTVS